MKPSILQTFTLSLLLSLSLLSFFFISLRPTTTTTTTTLPPPPDLDLRIRPGFRTYSSYLHHQLSKSLNPNLRRLWLTRDWSRKIKVFSLFFSNLQQAGLLSNSYVCLCVGSRVGQEVQALKRVGVPEAIGIDLVPYPPLVIKGDFHHQPFDDETFHFEFSNVFDHVLYPEKFVGEIQRTLKPGGVCVLHVAINKRSDKYSVNDLYSVRPLVRLFNGSDLVRVRKVDGFGLDTEVVFRKRGGGQPLSR